MVRGGMTDRLHPLPLRIVQVVSPQTICASITTSPRDEPY